MMCWGSWKLAHIIPSPLSDWIVETGEKIQDYWDDITHALYVWYKKTKKKWWKW
jgi:hypothetical protein